MNTATTNPPIRIRRITAPAIEASKDPRPSPLATSPPKPASQAKDLGDPTRRYWKKTTTEDEARITHLHTRNRPCSRVLRRHSGHAFPAILATFSVVGKRSFGSFASFGPEKTEGNPANDPAKCRPGAMPYSARAAAGLHTIGAKHVQSNSSRSNRHPDRSP
jgi:hypothetical protein